MADEWYRSTAWDAAAQADFEARLGRARASGRQQYLLIKGQALRHSGQLEAAKAVLQRSIDLGTYDFHVASALESLGDIAVLQGQPEVAEGYYRRVLSEHPSLNGTTVSMEIALAEILLDRDTVASRDEAQAFLDSWLARPGLKFDNQLFRWHLALLRLAERIGDQETVQRAARTALHLAERGPQLPRHKDVGLVQADKKLLARLRKKAR